MRRSRVPSLRMSQTPLSVGLRSRSKTIQRPSGRRRAVPEPLGVSSRRGSRHATVATAACRRRTRQRDEAAAGDHAGSAASPSTCHLAQRGAVRLHREQLPMVAGVPANAMDRCGRLRGRCRAASPAGPQQRRRRRRHDRTVCVIGMRASEGRGRTGRRACRELRNAASRRPLATSRHSLARPVGSSQARREQCTSRSSVLCRCGRWRAPVPVRRRPAARRPGRAAAARQRVRGPLLAHRRGLEERAPADARMPSTCRCRGCVRPSAAIASPRTAAATRCACRTTSSILRRFVTLRARAAGAGAEAAASLLREVLALWRGAPLADLADDGIPHAELAHLEEARLAALDAADHATWSSAGIGARPRAQPCRARIHTASNYRATQLCVALYRQRPPGRRARRLRRRPTSLRDDLGLQPARLRACTRHPATGLRARTHRREPSLAEAARRDRPVPGAYDPPPRRARRRGRRRPGRCRGARHGTRSHCGRPAGRTDAPAVQTASTVSSHRSAAPRRRRSRHRPPRRRRSAPAMATRSRSHYPETRAQVAFVDVTTGLCSAACRCPRESPPR